MDKLIQCKVHCNCDDRICLHAAWHSGEGLKHVLKFPGKHPMTFLCGMSAKKGTLCPYCDPVDCGSGPSQFCVLCLMEVISIKLIHTVATPNAHTGAP